ncbi:DUF1735 domain-containing protein [Parafilimonas sp.]|uniref:DUF1735 domain-containing protein n=1 Tax=Parafilimonas sp. TaxID=1969739 RepID=UPI0039E31CDC
MTKKLYKNKLWMFLLLVVGTLTHQGCKDKDVAFPTNSDETTAIIELGNTELADSYSSVYSLYSNSGKFINDTAGFYVIVNYNGETTYAPEDITVTLEINSDALDAYNTENSTSYALMDENIASFSTTVIIPKDSSYARFRVVVNDTTGFDFDSTYALPLTITSTTYGTISANTGTKLFSFVGQNAYAGTYTEVGYFYHPSSPRSLSLTTDVTTLSSNSVKIAVGDLGSSEYYVRVTIDPDTYALSIEDYGTGVTMYALDALPDSNPGYTAAWTSSSLCNNTYDPETGIFYLRIGYLGSTGWRVSEQILTPE